MADLRAGAVRDAAAPMRESCERNWICCAAVAKLFGSEQNAAASCKALGSASASAREGYEGPRDVTSLSLSASLTGLLGSIPGGPLTAAVLLEA